LRGKLTIHIQSLNYTQLRQFQAAAHHYPSKEVIIEYLSQRFGWLLASTYQRTSRKSRENAKHKTQNKNTMTSSTDYSDIKFEIKGKIGIIKVNKKDSIFLP
jgi:hypothetical protein